MKRRNFLRTGSMSAFILPAILTGGILGKGISANQTDATKAELLNQEVDEFKLNEVTMDELQTRMASKELSSVQITQLYLDRIQAIDKNGPMLNSVIELNPDALSIAAAMDTERAAGKIRGPLHGIPVLIKDNINTGDKMMTTAGSLALMGNHAVADAFIIVQLRKAGAVILGKTNLSEWANYRSTHSSSGWSSRGGQTKNPYVLNRTPSGSSAGSGSSAAANLCVIAIGTETDGSIVSPASVNGLVGIKPTVGLLSRTGIIPISATQDTAGPMGRTVRDAAILLGALKGVDVHDAATLESKGKTPVNYLSALKADGLKGKRIGIEKSSKEGQKGINKLLTRAIQTLRDQGAEVIEVELLKRMTPLDTLEGKVLSFEFKDGVNAYLAANPAAGHKNLASLIEFNSAHASTAMPFFEQEIFLEAQARAGLDSAEYVKAHTELQKGSRKAIDSVLAEYKLDAICAPTNGIAGCIDIINGDYDTGFSFSTPSAVSGYPHITVPMGQVNELPVGLSFIGTAYAEASLITLAYAYEQASKFRAAPRFFAIANPA